ncbi:unnamed protein product [Closterium sp. Yama58-4]|nr:unnamed protein product [Closterium sp. Yama58-4]
MGYCGPDPNMLAAQKHRGQDSSPACDPDVAQRPAQHADAAQRPAQRSDSGEGEAEHSNGTMRGEGESGGCGVQGGEARPLDAAVVDCAAEGEGLAAVLQGKGVDVLAGPRQTIGAGLGLAAVLQGKGVDVLAGPTQTIGLLGRGGDGEGEEVLQGKGVEVLAGPRQTIGLLGWGDEGEGEVGAWGDVMCVLWEVQRGALMSLFPAPILLPFTPSNCTPPKPPCQPVVVRCDAVVIGSGCGGAIIAAQLAEAAAGGGGAAANGDTGGSGWQRRVLVLEAGGYFFRSDLSLLEAPSAQMYDTQGFLTTEDGGVALLAGRTVGGGSAVNWSASFRTPPHVTREWASEYGLKQFESPEYAAAMDAVCEKIQVTADETLTPHSLSNAALKAGCSALGCHHAITPRNTNQPHPSPQRIWYGTSLPPLSPIPPTYSSSPSPPPTSLRTPPLLLASGLTNPAIGSSLRVHPVTSAWGFFPETAPSLPPSLPAGPGYLGPIMSVNSREVANWETTGYGAMIQVREQVAITIAPHLARRAVCLRLLTLGFFSSLPVPPHPVTLSPDHQTPTMHPGLLGCAIPWLGSQTIKQSAVRFDRTASLIAIVRDRGRGTVRADGSGRPVVTYRLCKEDQKSMQEALLLSLRILRAAGAVELGTLHQSLKPFRCLVPPTVQADLADAAASTANAELDGTDGPVGMDGWHRTSDAEFEAYLKSVAAAGFKLNDCTLFSAHQTGSCPMVAFMIGKRLAERVRNASMRMCLSVVDPSLQVWSGGLPIWTDVGCLSVPASSADPVIVLLPDGSIRLYHEQLMQVRDVLKEFPHHGLASLNHTARGALASASADYCSTTSRPSQPPNAAPLPPERFLRPGGTYCLLEHPFLAAHDAHSANHARPHDLTTCAAESTAGDADNRTDDSESPSGDATIVSCFTPRASRASTRQRAAVAATGGGSGLERAASMPPIPHSLRAALMMPTTPRKPTTVAASGAVALPPSPSAAAAATIPATTLPPLARTTSGTVPTQRAPPSSAASALISPRAPPSSASALVSPRAPPASASSLVSPRALLSSGSRKLVRALTALPRPHRNSSRERDGTERSRVPRDVSNHGAAGPWSLMDLVSPKGAASASRAENDTTAQLSDYTISAEDMCSWENAIRDLKISRGERDDEGDAESSERQRNGGVRYFGGRNEAPRQANWSGGLTPRGLPLLSPVETASESGEGAQQPLRRPEQQRRNAVDSVQAAGLVAGVVSRTNMTILLNGVPVVPNMVVAKDGSGDFTTLQEAIYYVPPAYLPNQGTKIFVKAGWYNETIIIRPYMRYLALIGDPEGGGSTVSCNRYSGMLNENGDMLSTLNTGCFVVFADDFTAVNFNFENASPRPPPNSYIYQAVAVRVTANRTAFYNCSIKSFQDTLYAHKGWQYYKDCYIFGTVDFIFGQAKARFESCVLQMSSYGFASVTAQKRDIKDDDNCFVMVGNRIIGQQPIIAQGWLGRSWGQYACTIFAHSYMDEIIGAEAWNNFYVRSREWTTFYAEYNNTGIGANLDGRVLWLKTLTPAARRYFLNKAWIRLDSWFHPFPQMM